MIRDLAYRKNFRQVILNHLGSEEIWACHPRLEKYLVSNKGRIYSFYNGKELKQFLNSDGYLTTNLHLIHKGRRCVMVHRIVAETFIGFLGMDNYFYEVNHIDGNKKNNNLENLEWLTRDENLQHARDNNLVKILYGEENGNSKLTNRDVSDIIEFRKLGFGPTEIAKAYNMNRNYISLISKGLKRSQNVK